jgi:hypothetical protein
LLDRQSFQNNELAHNYTDRHAVAGVSMLRFFLFASIVVQPLTYRLDQNEIGDADCADGHEPEADLIQSRHGGLLPIRHCGDVADVLKPFSVYLQTPTKCHPPTVHPGHEGYLNPSVSQCGN